MWRFTLPADLNDLYYAVARILETWKFLSFVAAVVPRRRLLRKSQVGNAGKQVNHLRQTRMIPLDKEIKFHRAAFLTYGKIRSVG